MLRDRYAAVDLFALVPKLAAGFEPELRELDGLLDDDAVVQRVKAEMVTRAAERAVAAAHRAFAAAAETLAAGDADARSRRGRECTFLPCGGAPATGRNLTGSPWGR